MIARIITKPRGSTGHLDPLNQRETLGIKIEVDGRQFGAYFDTAGLRKLGIGVSADNSFEFTLTELIEGNPPAAVVVR